MRRAFLGGLLLTLLPPPLAAQATLRTAVDTTLLNVGDRITLTIEVDHPRDARARLPDSISVAPFEVLDVSVLPVVATDAGTRSSWALTLAAFELGELEIPSIPVEVVGADGSVESLDSDRYAVEVVTVGADESGDIRDIRGPLGIPISSWVVLLWIVLPLVLAALLYAVVRRLRGRGEDVPRAALGPLPRPPHEVALEALAALEASSLLDDGQVKEYHIAASDILRTYVEDRFRVEALEMTTREVLEGLADIGADPSFRVGLRTFLESCDLVKFAKVRPDAGTSRTVLELGRRIVVESVTQPPAGDQEREVALAGESR